MVPGNSRAMDRRGNTSFIAGCRGGWSLGTHGPWIGEVAHHLLQAAGGMVPVNTRAMIGEVAHHLVQAAGGGWSLETLGPWIGEVAHHLVQTAGGMVPVNTWAMDRRSSTSFIAVVSKFTAGIPNIAVLIC